MSANAYAARARVRSEYQDYSGALADYDQALRLAPDRAGIYLFNGAVGKLLMGKRAEAEADYRRALESSPAERRDDVRSRFERA